MGRNGQKLVLVVHARNLSVLVCVKLPLQYRKKKINSYIPYTIFTVLICTTDCNVFLFKRRREKLQTSVVSLTQLVDTWFLLVIATLTLPYFMQETNVLIRERLGKKFLNFMQTRLTVRIW